MDEVSSLLKAVSICITVGTMAMLVVVRVTEELREWVGRNDGQAFGELERLLWFGP